MSNFLSIKACMEIGSQTTEVALSSAARTILISGPTGSGKSSLVKLIAGIQYYKNAEITVDGSPWQSQDIFVKPWQRQVSWMPQDALLFPHLNVLKNICFSPQVDRDIAQIAINALGIRHLLDRFPKNLSGGEKQLVCLARAIAKKSKIMILDEPFSALDKSTKSKATGFVKEYSNKCSNMLLLVSHEQPYNLSWIDQRWEFKDNSAVIVH